MRAAFVGRVPELDRLETALARAAGGDGVTVVCSGEAGIGKTRLITEFTERARASGASILSGGCVELGPVGLPYGPFAEALRGAVSTMVLDPLDLHPTAAEQLAMLVPDIGRGDAEAPAIDLAGLGQVRLFETVVAAFERVRAVGPTVLVIEDLHWADRSTLDLLSFLVRAVEPLGVMILATVRTDEVPRDGPLAMTLAELGRRPSVERLELQPLNLAETTDYLRSVLGEEPEPHLVARIRRRSDGNPFFIEQLAWAYVDGEAAIVPPSLRDILLTQLSRQPVEVQRLLEAAAIAGPLADEHLLATVLEMPARDILASLRVAVRAALLVPSRVYGEEVYGFRHALMAEATEADLLDGERRRLHGRCADALVERRPEDGAALAQWAARVAHHRERSGDREATVAASIEAGVHAAAVAAHGDAMEQYRRAIRLLPGVKGPRRWGDWDESELFAQAAACAALLADARSAAEYSRRALELLPDDADPWRRGALHSALSEHLWIAGDPAFVEALVEAARVIPVDPPTAARAQALISLGFYEMFRQDHGRALAALDEAIRVAGQAGARREEALARVVRIPSLVLSGDVAGAPGELDRAWNVLREAPASPSVAVVYMDLGGISSWLGQDAFAVDVCRAGLELARRHGFETYYGGGLVAAGADALVNLGRLREADELVGTALWTTTGGYADTTLRISTAQVALALGDLVRARAVLDPAVWPDGGDTSIFRYWHSVEAELVLEEGGLEAVEAIARSALDAPAANIPQPDVDALLAWLAVRAEADLAERARARRDRAAEASCRTRGERYVEEARDLLAAPPVAWTPMHRRVAAYTDLAAAEATRLHGRPDPAAWRCAALAWDGTGSVTRPRYARIREAEALLMLRHDERAERARAGSMLAAVHREALAMEAGLLVRMAEGIARRARLELHEHRAPSRAAASKGAVNVPEPGRPYGLTDREVEILRLLAEGLTNRQIGERLFISPKTAGVHVSNILGKLGVSSRIQAATLAHRLGLGAVEEAGVPHLMA